MGQCYSSRKDELNSTRYATSALAPEHRHRHAKKYNNEIDYETLFGPQHQHEFRSNYLPMEIDRPTSSHSDSRKRQQVMLHSGFKCRNAASQLSQHQQPHIHSSSVSLFSPARAISVSLLSASTRRLSSGQQAVDQERIVSHLLKLNQHTQNRNIMHGVQIEHLTDNASACGDDVIHQTFVAAEPNAAYLLLAKATEIAFENKDHHWASSQVVADLFADDAVYISLDGSKVIGKEHVLHKLNEGMLNLITRINGANLSSQNGKDQHFKMTTAAPCYQGDGIWTIKYTFQMMLMKIHVRDQYKLDKFRRIAMLKRTRV